MGKFILNVLQLIIIGYVGYKVLRFMLFKKKNKRSIIMKVGQLLTNRVHYHLDNALRNQRKVLQGARNTEVKYPSNVIPLRKTK